MGRREEMLRKLIWQDQEDRAAYAGELDLPPWARSMAVYEETEPDVLVAKITLGSTLRWLGISKLWKAEALKSSWDALFTACQQRDVDGCRYWQREVARRRDAYFGDEGPPKSGVPRRPVPPRLHNGNTREEPDRRA